MDDNHHEEGKRDPDLFLIEMKIGEHTRYVIAEPVITVDPDQDDRHYRWSELAALFEGDTLRAVPMPSRLSGRLAAQRGVSTGPGVSTGRGVSTGPGVMTHVEVNVVKIEKDH